MVQFEEHIAKIRETKEQIERTNSKQRKYELHRHLNKLLKEYKTAVAYHRRYAAHE